MRLLNKATSLILSQLIWPFICWCNYMLVLHAVSGGQLLYEVMSIKTFLSRACIFENIQSMQMTLDIG